ncbi:MAG TPA: hypothetical protein VG389_23200 [Myxococcota bacterium]|jgi:hypothetical protein|nr:hypothetical protein [Myxococcota bacterium]
MITRPGLPVPPAPVLALALALCPTGGCFFSSTGGGPSDAGPPPPGPNLCADGLDNDGDGLVDADDPGCQEGSDGDELYVTVTSTETEARAATILFVIDDSGSMCQEQANLRGAVDAFLTALLTTAPGMPFHMGVVTTDTSNVSVAGRLRNTPQNIVASPLCPTPPPTTDCTTGLPSPLPKWVDETTPDVERVFNCLASVGIQGFGGETALGAARMAMSPALLADPSANQGFYIPGSLLMIVFLGDEDDCSVCSGTTCSPLPGLQFNLDCAIDRVNELTPIEAFVTYFQTLSNGTGGALGGAVFPAAFIGLDPAGNSEGPVVPDPGGADNLVPICAVAGQGSAAPAPRIEAFTRRWDVYAEESICDADYREEFGRVGARLGSVVEVGCLTEPPCAGIDESDLSVVLNGSVLTPVADYDLQPDAGCEGGWSVRLTNGLAFGATLTITYPGGPGACP